MIRLVLSLFLLLFIAHIIKHPNVQKPRIYVKKRLKKTNKTFLFSKLLLFLNEKGVKFYAELGGVFFLIFDRNSWVRVVFKPCGAMQPTNANQCFIRGNCAQNENAYYQVNKSYATSNFKGNLEIKINNLQFEWFSKTKTFKLSHNNGNYVLKLGGKISGTAKSFGEFKFNCDSFNLDYNSFNFNYVSKLEKTKFLVDNFGFYNTGKWKNLHAFPKLFNDSSSLEKTYFSDVISHTKPEVKLINDLQFFNFSLIVPNSFLIMPKVKNVRIDLTRFGFSEFIFIKNHKQFVEVRDLKTQFKLFIKTKSGVKNAFIGKVFGTFFLFIEFLKIGVVELIPFSLAFDSNLLSKTSLKSITINKKIQPDLFSFNREFGLKSIINNLNFQIVLGCHDVLFLFKKCNFLNLPKDLGFCYANLILSDAVCFGKTINSTQLRKFLLSFLPFINTFNKTDAFCYLFKLSLIVRDVSLKDWIISLLPNFDVVDWQNNEYVFCHLFGIAIVNNQLQISQTKLDFKMKLFVNGKQIEVESSNKNAVIVDGIEFSNKNTINLLSNFSDVKLFVAQKQN